jgi:hypothetical protein
MLPAEFSHLKFDKTLYRKTKRFLKKNDPGIIYIYGGIDPWGASGVGDIKFLRKKKNIKVYTLPKGSHRTRIGSFPKEQQDDIIRSITKWLQ